LKNIAWRWKMTPEKRIREGKRSLRERAEREDADRRVLNESWKTYGAPPMATVPLSGIERQAVEDERERMKG
jgi:hypothetical protein